MTEDHPPGVAARPRRSRLAVVAVALILVALTGAMAYWNLSVRSAERARAQMVQAAREGVVHLTTIDHERIDGDVQRILDSSTGPFRDDFASRSESFADAARKAQSKSVGTVDDAALESQNGDGGIVLVAATVMTSNRGAPEQQANAWRTRVTVQKVDGRFKVSAVEFVR